MTNFANFSISSLVDREKAASSSRVGSGAWVAAHACVGLAVSGTTPFFARGHTHAAAPFPSQPPAAITQYAATTNGSPLAQRHRPAISKPPFPCLQGRVNRNRARGPRRKVATVVRGGLHDGSPMGRSRRTHCHEHAVGQQRLWSSPQLWQPPW